MKDRSAIQGRYLRDNLPVRRGGLAANLSGIKPFAAHEASRDAVESLIDGSKYFIEWTALKLKSKCQRSLSDCKFSLHDGNISGFKSCQILFVVGKWLRPQMFGRGGYWSCQGFCDTSAATV